MVFRGIPTWCPVFQRDPNLVFQRDPNLEFQRYPNLVLQRDPNSSVSKESQLCAPVFQRDPITGCAPVLQRDANLVLALTRHR